MWFRTRISLKTHLDMLYALALFNDQPQRYAISSQPHRPTILLYIKSLKITGLEILMHRSLVLIIKQDKNGSDIIVLRFKDGQIQRMNLNH